MKTVVVIPAYNEASQIGLVLDNLKASGFFDIVVVDDASSDNTREISMGRKVHVLSHMVNRGQGAALGTGTQYALQLGADYIVHFDADGQMRAEDINKLLNELTGGSFDVVIGSRFGGTTNNIPTMRRFLLFGTRVFNKVFLGINLRDPQSGFRAVTRFAAQKIEIKHDRMAHCSQMMQDMHEKSLRIKEVPVTIEYTEYSLQKGQRFFDAFKVVVELVLGKLVK